MRRYPNRLVRYAAMATAFAVCAFSTIGSAFADIFGHLRLTIKASGGAAPLANAKVTFHDSANVRPDIVVTTDSEGVAMSPPLETRDWEVRIEQGGNVVAAQMITVVADTVTDVEVVAPAPAAPGQAPENPTINLIRKAQSIISAVRSKSFADLFPVLGGNNFGLENLLRTIPGFTAGAAGQIFPRGDQFLGSVLVNGLKLPDSFASQFTGNLTSNIVSNLEAMTGGLPAEYAGLASSVINVNLNGGTLQPKNGLNLFGGTFATFDGSVVLSGQLGRQMGEPDGQGRVARNLGYFVSLSDRQTDNSLQSPQPNEQEANNKGKYNSFFGNFDYRPNQKDQWNLLVNHAPSERDVPNRTGLGDSWPTSGLGFGGYLNNRNRGENVIPSQEEMGIDITNEAVNNFGLFSWRRRENPSTDWMLSFGASHVGLDQTNSNPGIDLKDLPFDSSQEFNPNIARNNRSWQAQGHFARKTGGHNFKFGFFLDENNGRESYRMTPGSILALDALIAADPKLAPPANPVIIGEGPKGEPIQAIDSLGNPMFTPTGEPAPTVRTAMKRRNQSFFAQDDWKVSDRFTVNFGARWDRYTGEQSLGLDKSDKDMVSPRVNMAFQYDHRTVLRLSYNRLFQAPPMVQGMVVGANPLVGETDQFDFSFERSIGPTAFMKISAYQKKTKDQTYLKQLVEGLQDGPLSAVNFDSSDTKGIEISAQMTPINGKGFSGFLTWTNQTSKPHGMANDGSEAPDFLPQDQLNTITAGFNYMWANGANWALSWEYGSGLPSADVFNTGRRKQQARGNFRFQSGQTAFGPFGGWQVDVENLFDSKTVIGFNSAVNGTNFQQGRRITFSAFSQFLSR